MINFISVIISTYNPRTHVLNRVLKSLKNQTLSFNQWELIIIDNCSTQPIQPDISWQIHNKILIENKPGLTNARLCGFNNAVGDLIIMVDDDNLLDEYYLENVLNIFRENEKLGAAGGKSLPEFEIQPPDWIKEFKASLALRDLGNKELLASWNNEYPGIAPIGAGMAIRKKSLLSYQNKKHAISDRKANSLSSGGDNDIILEVLKSGWQIGYFPSLSLTHVIPTERLQTQYLARLINNSSRSWIQLLESHGINPWKKISAWTVLFRKIKAWFVYHAWTDAASYIKWQGACGMYDGLADN